MKSYEQRLIEQCRTAVRVELQTPMWYGGERFGYQYLFDHATLYNMGEDWHFAVVEVLRHLQREVIDHAGLPMERFLHWEVVNPIQLPMRSK